MNPWVITSRHPRSTIGGAEIFWQELSYHLSMPFDFITGDNGPEIIRVLQCYTKVFKRLAKERPHLVFSSGAYGGLWPISNIPRINVYHGTYEGYRRNFDNPFKTTLNINILKKLERRGGHGAIKVAVSNQAAYELSKYYHFSSDEIIIIENGVDTSRFKPSSALEKRKLRKKYGLPANKKIVLFIGPLTYSKGVDLLKLILNRLDRVLLIALTSTKNPIINFGNCITSSVPYSQIHEFYMLSDLFISPSRYEAFSLSLLEAMSCGLPFVSFRTGWLHDFGEDFSMAIANDVTDFVDKTSVLLDDVDAQNFIGKKGRFLAELHDWTIVAGKYKDLIEKVIVN